MLQLLILMLCQTPLIQLLHILVIETILDVCHSNFLIQCEYIVRIERVKVIDMDSHVMKTSQEAPNPRCKI